MANLSHEAINPKGDEPSLPSGGDAPTAPTLLVMLALAMAVFLAALDTVAITVALPSIAEDLMASDTAYSWIASVYLLAQSATVPIWGKFSDAFGRKPILLAANAIFMAGSLIAALSVNVAMLIATRAVQGAGAGGLLVLVNICVSDLCSLRYVRAPLPDKYDSEQ